jgi:hypothetical protein
MKIATGNSKPNILSGGTSLTAASISVVLTASFKFCSGSGVQLTHTNMRAKIRMPYFVSETSFLIAESPFAFWFYYIRRKEAKKVPAHYTTYLCDKSFELSCRSTKCSRNVGIVNAENFAQSMVYKCVGADYNITLFVLAMRGGC